MKKIFNLITDPGDKMEARVTDSGRQVINIKKGNAKYSATRYSNGRIVETRSYMPDSNSTNKLPGDLN